MVAQFIDALTDNLASGTVWSFYFKMLVTCLGLTKPVSHLLLFNLACSSTLTDKVMNKLLTKLLSSLNLEKSIIWAKMNPEFKISFH